MWWSTLTRAGSPWASLQRRTCRNGRFHSGLQILHIGPVGAEGPTIEAIHRFIREQGFTFDGRKQKHHEIYLSDPRRAAPEKWKTIIRQPVSEVGSRRGREDTRSAPHP